MFHKLKDVTALADYRLCVQFAEGVTKIYDVKPLFDKWAPFEALRSTPHLFYDVKVDVGGYGIIWNDELDLSCDESLHILSFPKLTFVRLRGENDCFMDVHNCNVCLFMII